MILIDDLTPWSWPEQADPLDTTQSPVQVPAPVTQAPSCDTLSDAGWDTVTQQSADDRITY